MLSINVKLLQEICRTFDCDLKKEKCRENFIGNQSVIKMVTKYLEYMIKFNWINFIYAFLIGHSRFLIFVDYFSKKYLSKIYNFKLECIKRTAN